MSTDVFTGYLEGSLFGPDCDPALALCAQRLAMCVRGHAFGGHGAHRRVADVPLWPSANSPYVTIIRRVARAAAKACPIRRTVALPNKSLVFTDDKTGIFKWKIRAALERNAPEFTLDPGVALHTARMVSA